MEEKNKIGKIIEEMTLYLLDLDVCSFDFSLCSTSNKTEISFKIDKLDSNVEAEIKNTICAKRDRIIEEYSWQLMGEGDACDSSSLISSLIDECSFEKNNDLFVIRLVIYI